MAKSKSTLNRAKTGCLLLFALPFLVGGLVTTYLTASTALRHTAMQSWLEVPATILSAELEQNRGHHRPGGAQHRQTSYKATATYTFEHEGTSYRGNTVGMHEMSDNFGDFQRKAYDVLKRHRDSGKPLSCYVNPQEPAQSILFPQVRWELMSFFSIFGTIFGCVGVGMMTAALVASRRSAEHVSSDVPADEPWRARADWASGMISSDATTAATVPVLAAVALWWWIGSAPLTLKLPAIFQASGGGWKWITLVFPLIGCVLIIALAYQLLRRRKYGESALQLAATPGVVGGQLAGVVLIPQMIQPDGGFRVKCSCVEHKSDRNNKNHEVVLWQDERLVTEPMRDVAAGTTSVPVLFAIPFDAKESSRPSSKRDIRWILEIYAATSGVNYTSRFEVPVFKTADSRADFTLDESLAADFVSAPPASLVLREAGIIKEPLAGSGVRLVFPAARNLGSAVVATAILAAFTGAIGFMLYIDVPILFPIVFGLVALVIFWITVDLWFYRSIIEARADGITFRGGFLGIGRKHSWSANEVKRIATSESMSSGRSVWKNVEIVLANKKKKVVAQSIGSKPAQEAVVEELRVALGRQIA